MTGVSTKPFPSMARQVKIKEIAEMAGVSAGTVDRVLHKRGKVSEANQEAVERVLDEVGYRQNIHISAISFRKTIKIAVTMPDTNDGEYWNSIKKGIDHAIYEYFDIKLKCEFHHYDQFDSEACAEAYDKVLSSEPDAVIISPVFVEETQRLCCCLDKSVIPYIFVDSEVDGTHPIATYTTDQYACGKLAARLLSMSIPEDSSMAILEAERLRNRTASSSMARTNGFRAYMKSIGQEERVRHASYPPRLYGQTKERIETLLMKNPDIKGISILNSGAHTVSEILHGMGRDDISLMSFDLTEMNVKGLEDGSIVALLCQRPEQQGFNAIKTMISYLLYKSIEGNPRCVMPIDVVFKENLRFYREIISV